MNDKKNLTSKQKLGIIVVSVFGGLILLGGSCVGCVSCLSCMGSVTDSSNSSDSTSTTNNTFGSSETSSKTKSEKLKEKYSFYEKSVKEIKKQMKVTQEQADDIFIILVNYCGLDGAIRSIYTTDNGATYSYYWEGSAKTQEITLENGSIVQVSYLSEILYPNESVTNSSNSSESNSETSSSQIEIPEPRETAIGKSNKEIDWFISPKATTVRNDVTGNWRYSGFSESGIDISEYALDYYNKYFESDYEIHAVINFANKTTTRISCLGDMLFVTVLEYVDGEEHDAKLMFSGEVLQDFIVYTDNGDIELIDNSTTDVSTSDSPLDVTSTAISTSPSTQQSVAPPESTSKPSNSSTKENHFNDYSNPEQQNTTKCVLNTSTKKYHKPSCSDVKKIKPENYSTIESESAARSLGYSACKKCH